MPRSYLFPWTKRQERIAVSSAPNAARREPATRVAEPEPASSSVFVKVEQGQVEWVIPSYAIPSFSCALQTGRTGRALSAASILRIFLCTIHFRYSTRLSLHPQRPLCFFSLCCRCCRCCLSLSPPHTHCPPHSVLGTPGHRVDASQPRHSTRADSAALSATHSQLAARARPRASPRQLELVARLAFLLAPRTMSSNTTTSTSR